MLTFHPALRRDAKTVIALLMTNGAFGAACAAADIEVYHVHTDHLGAPRYLTDDKADVTWSRTATPFGAPSSIEGAVGWLLGFPEQHHDSESQLQYNPHRYYDAVSGR